MPPLTPVEARVLASLVEKQKTTPDYYPMTLNALTNACNQKSNRHPQTFFEEAAVEDALRALEKRQIVGKRLGMGHRAIKFTHAFPNAYQLNEAETAVLVELMLRGPQTIGELRGHASRMYAFETLEEVVAALEALRQREAPLVVELPTQPGQSAARFAHLLSGEPEVEPTPQASAPPLTGLEDLRDEVARLREELDALRQEFVAFREQFE